MQIKAELWVIVRAKRGISSFFPLHEGAELQIPRFTRDDKVNGIGVLPRDTVSV